MASATDLMGLGMAGPLAGWVGMTLGAVTSAGTASTTATDLQNVTLANVTSASSQTGVRLNSSTPLGVPIVVFTASSDTVKVFPPASGTINGGTATTGSVDVAQNKTRILWRYSSTAWASILTA